MLKERKREKEKEGMKERDCRRKRLIGQDKDWYGRHI